MSRGAVEPRTTLPCPDWCQYEPHHGFDTIAHDGTLVRFHTRDFGEDLRVCAQEKAVTDDGPVWESGPPVLDASVDGQLSLDEARQLAGELTAALTFLAGLS